MSSTNKIIKSHVELRANKLKNKKTQLENLLRSRERIDYEIKNLKRSIAKDKKQIQKESLLIKNRTSKEEVLEVVQLTAEEDPESFKIEDLLELYSSISQEFKDILDLLLKYEEDV